MARKIINDSRWKIIQVVTTPLGFFTLALLVVEAVLSVIALKVTGQAQIITICGIIGLLLLLIIVVAYIGVKHPNALMSSSCDNDSELSAITLYEYISCYREDEIQLDGTQISIATMHMRANATMHGYKASISSVSKSLFPFSKFNIELITYHVENNNKVSIRIIDDSRHKKRWELKIEPPLKKNEELKFTTRITMCGNRPMCFEDLIEVARINNSESLLSKAWKKITVPTDNWSWSIVFPSGYQIKSVQPCVLRNENRIKDKEVELERERYFNYFRTHDGRTKVELKLKRPLLFYAYGFAWQPPSCDEYEKLCKNRKIKPYHGLVTRTQQSAARDGKQRGGLGK